MSSKVERHDVSRPDGALVERVAVALKAGQLVVLPTETVYGLVALADKAGLERLAAVKGRDREKPIARFAASLEQVELEAVVTPKARALARKYWPGPLTLVLDLKAGGPPVGYRVPGLQFAREVVKRVGVQLAATSANRSGEGEPVTFDLAWTALGAAADLGIDGGPALLGEPSTVVRAPPDGTLTVLREGFLSKEAVDRAVQRVVLFVCTGNTCRSPMAEAILRGKLAKALEVPAAALGTAGFLIRSAGTAAGAGGAAAEHAVTVVRDMGYDLADHRTQPLTPELLDEASVIYALAPSHAHTIQDWFPEYADKVKLVDERGVPDPVGGPLERYRECARLLDARLDVIVAELVRSRT